MSTGETELTQEQKIALYRKGDYLMSVPPVHTTYWTESDWIVFIDRSGQWQPNKQER